METEYKDKIADILISGINSAGQQFDLLREINLANSYPLGTNEYCKKRIFEIKETLSKKSLLGSIWVKNGCKEDLVKPEGLEWLLQYAMALIDYSDKKLRWDDFSKFIREYLRIREYRKLMGEHISNVNNKYEIFWMQFKKINTKTNKPYLTDKQIAIFLDQAFGGKPIVETFKPDMTKKELYHAVFLFYTANKKDFKKTQITEIMKKNFPEYFPKTLDEETKKIRDGLMGTKHIFQKNQDQ